MAKESGSINKLSELDSTLLMRMKDLASQIISLDAESKKLIEALDSNIEELMNIRHLLHIRQIPVAEEDDPLRGGEVEGIIDRKRTEGSVLRRARQERKFRMSEQFFGMGLDELKQYVEKIGHSSVPRGYRTEDTQFPLYAWVNSVRRANRLSELTADRIQALESVNHWHWDTKDGTPQPMTRTRLRWGTPSVSDGLRATEEEHHDKFEDLRFNEIFDRKVLTRRVWELIHEANTPLHISDIYMKLLQEGMPMPGRADQRVILSRIHRATDMFYRIPDLPGTYGIIEWKGQRDSEIRAWANKKRKTRDHVVPREIIEELMQGTGLDINGQGGMNGNDS